MNYSGNYTTNNNTYPYYLGNILFNTDNNANPLTNSGTFNFGNYYSKLSDGLYLMISNYICQNMTNYAAYMIITQYLSSNYMTFLNPSFSTTDKKTQLIQIMFNAANGTVANPKTRRRKIFGG